MSCFFLPTGFSAESLSAALTDIFGDPSSTTKEPELNPDYSTPPLFVDPLPFNKITISSNDNIEDKYFLSFYTSSKRKHHELEKQVYEFRDTFEPSIFDSSSSSISQSGQKKKIMRAPMLNPPPVQKPVHAKTMQPKETTASSKPSAPSASTSAKSPTPSKPSKAETSTKQPEKQHSHKSTTKAPTKVAKAPPKVTIQQPPSKLAQKPAPTSPVKPTASKVVGKLSSDRLSMLSGLQVGAPMPVRTRPVRVQNTEYTAPQMQQQQEEQTQVTRPPQQITRCTRKKGARPPSRATQPL
ncbi:hypothetical protein GPJ56_002286 [Histomonas meleagridis]|uniref:uncharacterized protein n=1 Tax=Histomonas meleagridis TaxID=135588 RepID=UPI0035596FEF|nr:hypothetical protein GPJ56_002286 [Histomonas meleagridis]KAH0804548.1 hypothetical protein GO595_003378 [Histomonas meleagridis]